MLATTLTLLIAVGVIWGGLVVMRRLLVPDSPATVQSRPRSAGRQRSATPIARKAFQDKALTKAERVLWADIQAHWAKDAA